MAHFGQRFADGGTPREGKPGAQSGRSRINDKLDLRPEESWDSALKKTGRDFGAQAAQMVPGLYPGYKIYQEATSAEPDMGEIKGRAFQGATEIGLASLGAQSLKGLRTFGDSLTPKTDAMLGYLGVGSSGVQPNIGGLRQGLETARGTLGQPLNKVDQSIPMRVSDDELNAAYDALRAARTAPETNRFSQAFEPYQAPAPVASPTRGGYSQSLPHDPKGLNIDEIDILSSFKPAYGAKPHADGGSVEGEVTDGPPVSGALISERGRGGRTDTLPMNVKAGSFVLPADVVSHLGQNDTQQGFRVLDRMFKGGPYGTKTRGVRGPSAPAPYQDGGSVPIIAAAGEYIVEPESVAAVGNGDVEMGHQILKKFVNMVRKDHIQTLKGLPQPVG
jgi:hypothetical protein